MSAERNPDRNILRLTKAIEMLERLPGDRLHMRNFFERNTCGTAGCLLGWMILSPWFRKHTDILNELHVETGVSFDDCTTFLGITRRDTERLFAEYGGALSAHAVSKEEVIWNLRELIAGRPARPYAALADHEDGPYAMDLPPGNREYCYYEASHLRVLSEVALGNSDFLTTAEALLGEA